METRIEDVLRSCCNDFFRILSVLSIFQCAFRPGSNKRLKSCHIACCRIFRRNLFSQNISFLEHIPCFRLSLSFKLVKNQTLIYNNIIRYFTENIGINRAGPIPIVSGPGWHVRVMSGWKNFGPIPIQDENPGRAAGMPTPVCNIFMETFVGNRVWKKPF